MINWLFLLNHRSRIRSTLQSRFCRLESLIFCFDFPFPFIDQESANKQNVLSKKCKVSDCLKSANQFFFKKKEKDQFIFLSCVYSYDVHSVINFQRICQTTWLLETICTSGNVFQTRFTQIKQTCHFNSGEASSIFSKEGKVFDSISLFCQLTYSENRFFFVLL